MPTDLHSQSARASARRRTRRSAGKPAASAGLPSINTSESPLAWLRRRKDKDGQPMLSATEFEAGERLRADFTFGQLMPSVTARWSPVGAGDGRPRASAGTGNDLQDHALAARQRIGRALTAVGPELAGILVDVCCHLKGLEDAERAKGWPLRSAKIVLQLGLQRLARHYGLLGDSGAAAGTSDDRPARIRHWGSDDYRPVIAAERD